MHTRPCFRASGGNSSPSRADTTPTTYEQDSVAAVIEQHFAEETTAAIAALSSQLDTIETNAGRTFNALTIPKRARDTFILGTPLSGEECRFRHSGWKVNRLRVYRALMELHLCPGRLDRFQHCGSCCHVQVSEDRKDIRTVAHFCRDRWCVPCGKARASVVYQNILQQTRLRFPRFITLTMRHNDTPLTDQIDRLFRSFRAFREREAFTEHVFGGVALMELKISERDGRWHPHLHILAEGTYWDARELSREWQSVTGDSSICCIKAITDPEHAAAYCCKYLSKPADQSLYENAEKLKEAINALRGRHLLTTFGTWRGIRLLERKPDTQPWIDVGPLTQIIRDAEKGNATAKRWLEALTRKLHPYEVTLDSNTT